MLRRFSLSANEHGLRSSIRLVELGRKRWGIARAGKKMGCADWCSEVRSLLEKCTLNWSLPVATAGGTDELDWDAMVACEPLVQWQQTLHTHSLAHDFVSSFLATRSIPIVGWIPFHLEADVDFLARCSKAQLAPSPASHAHSSFCSSCRTRQSPLFFTLRRSLTSPTESLCTNLH